MSAQVPDQHRTAVKRTREKLSNARHLPGDFYTSTDIEALEAHTHIWARMALRRASRRVPGSG